MSHLLPYAHLRERLLLPIFTILLILFVICCCCHWFLFLYAVRHHLQSVTVSELSVRSSTKSKNNEKSKNREKREGTAARAVGQTLDLATIIVYIMFVSKIAHSRTCLVDDKKGLGVSQNHITINLRL